MSFSDAFETSLFNLIFANANIANVGDVTGLRGSTDAGSLYISLHTADPGEAGIGTASEAAYTGYAREAVARSGAGFTVAGNAVENAAEILFEPCTAGSATVTYFMINTDISGAGTVLCRGLLGGGGLAISSGITPRFAAGALTGTID